MKTTTNILLATSAALLLTACGGGDDIIDAISGNRTYNLQKYIDTSSFSAQMTDINNVQATYKNSYDGTDGATHTHNSSIQIENLPAISYEIKTYLGHTQSIKTLTNNCFLQEGVTPSPIPTNATIGYVSDPVTLECHSGITMTVLHELRQGTGGDAVLVSRTSTNVIEGVSTATERMFTIDSSLNTLSYSMNTGLLSLHSTSVTQY